MKMEMTEKMELMKKKEKMEEMKMIKMEMAEKLDMETKTQMKKTEEKKKKRANLKRESRQVYGMVAGRASGGVVPELQVVMVPGGLVPQQQRAVHVELHPEIEGERWPPVRVQSMAV